MAFGAFLLAHPAMAQKKQLTMHDAVVGMRGGALMPENLSMPKWKNTTESLTHVVKNKQTSYLVQIKAASSKVDTLLSLHQLNQLLFQKDSLKSFPAYSWDANDQLLLDYRNAQYRLELFGNNWQLSQTSVLNPKAANKTPDNRKKQLAFTVDNNLYLLDNHNNIHNISSSNAPNVVYGASVHRNEFGISGGIFFSPNDNLLAFYKMDESMVEDYPIIDWSTTPAISKNIKYPMSGKTSHQVSIGIYNILSRSVQYLQIEGPKDQYLTNISWSPDEKYIYVGVLNRAQNHLKWNMYNAHNGTFVKTLFEERNEKYVEPQHPLFFVNKNEFVWMSQRDGYMHLYHYKADGTFIKQLTKGKWVVNSILGYDANNNNLIISGNKIDPREKHLFAVNVSNGKINTLHADSGTHHGVVHRNGKAILHTFQNATTPRDINIIYSHKSNVQPLLKATDKLAEYNTASVTPVVLKAADGTDLYGKLIKPSNFDANKKYPVIVYLYNGPHLQLITHNYPASGNLWYDYMAQEGFIVFTMDGRGSSNRGFEFESAIFRQAGQVEMQDQLKGVDFLKSLPYVDAERLGVHGWSYGGFMTTSLLTHYPDVFKVGVAGGPVIDWSLYEVMYTERYMDTPEENPDGYKHTELSSKADRIKAKLLMIHGTDDDVVVWQHSLKYIESSVKKGVQIDYYAYPGHQHNVVGKDRVHLMQKITDYFKLHL